MACLSRPENVVLVRDLLSGLGDGLALAGPTVEDVKAAVSEAANNVIVHAYGDGEGPLEVEIGVGRGELAVVVRDHGVGIGPRRIDDTHPGRGIGLAVIEALARSCELRAHAGPGLEVAMRFDTPELVELPGLPPREGAVDPMIGDPGAFEISLAPAALSGVVFERVVTGLAARAGFSIDRLSDVQLVMDALAARIVPALAGDEVRLGAVSQRRGVELTVSPLRAGGSVMLVADSAVAELGPVIERLADEVAMRHESGGEVLALVLRDRRAAR